MSEKEERVAWEGVKSRAGKAITSGPVQRVLEGLVSAAIRNQLGIYPSTARNPSGKTASNLSLIKPVPSWFGQRTLDLASPR